MTDGSCWTCMLSWRYGSPCSGFEVQYFFVIDLCIHSVPNYYVLHRKTVTKNCLLFAICVETFWEAAQTVCRTIQGETTAKLTASKDDMTRKSIAEYFVAYWHM